MTGRKLRIIHCFRSPVGGIFRHVRDLAKAQAKAGHEVGIVCDSTTGGAHEEKLIAEAGSYLALGVRRTAMQRHVGPGDLSSAWRTHRLIRDLAPDVLHGHGAKGGTYARMFGTLQKMSGRPVARIYSLHGGSLHYEENTATGKVFFLLERIMERATDELLFVSEYERQTYTRKIGAPKVPNRLIYNGLQPEEFEPVPGPHEADLLYIGMMRDLKGPDLFIAALPQVEAALGRPLRAVMVGDGDQLAEYQAQAAALGLTGRIRFLPPMKARDAFAMARLIVVPSRAEALPYIVLEALAAGMPMVATNVGGIPEIMPGREALLAEPEAGSIASRIADALSDLDAWRARMPPVSELRSRFGVDVMTQAVEAAYREAIAGRGSTASVRSI